MSHYLDPDVMPVDAFRQACLDGLFIDYDGFGYPVVREFVLNDTPIVPSRLDEIPPAATHVIWFNR